MKVKTKIICYSGRQKCNTKRIKEVEYTVVDLANGIFIREVNERVLK